jgi:transgelin
MSLDKDITQRLQEKYDPGMADEAREWIEECLGESLPDADLAESLKDGVILCRLLNIVSPGSTKYKVSKMPFVQVICLQYTLTKMENISRFLDGAKVRVLSGGGLTAETRRSSI